MTIEFDVTEIIGLIAGTLTTIAFVPQVVQLWRSRQAGDINLVTFSLFCVGVFLWMIYGALLARPAVFISNVITFLLAMGILVGKLKFGRHEEK